MASGDDASRRWRIVSANPTVPALLSLASFPGAVKLLAHVIGDFAVELPFDSIQLSGHAAEPTPRRKSFTVSTNNHSAWPAKSSRQDFNVRVICFHEDSTTWVLPAP